MNMYTGTVVTDAVAGNTVLGARTIFIEGFILGTLFQGCKAMNFL